MSKKRPDKKIILLEPSFKDILVCRDKASRPYIEVFVQEPENVSQQGLGILFGILEISDSSEDSSYVVNYLISIIKKEYFFSTKRGPIESFEAALHKANLALAQLAEHGQVSWIGKLNAVAAVIEKNNIHLAATGTASAFLVRGKSLSNVSEGQESGEDVNPLKTFQEVVSGRLDDKDKIILTTDSLFNIFSLEEMKRSAIKFSRVEFTQFLHTALVNELEKAAVLVIDMKEKEEEEEPEEERARVQKINAFSQQAFSKKSHPQDTAPAQEERKELIAELKKELEKSQGGFIDEKTGHIYIKDDEYAAGEPAARENYIKNFYQKVSSSGSSLAHSVKEKTKAKISSVSIPRAKLKVDLLKKKPAVAKEEIAVTEKIPKKSFREILSPIGYKIKNIFSSSVFHTKSFFSDRIFPLFGRMAVATKSATVRFFSWLQFKYQTYQIKYQEYQSKKMAGKKAKIEDTSLPKMDYISRPESMSPTREEKRQWFQQLSGQANVSENLAPIAIAPKTIDIEPTNSPIDESATARIIPSFSRLKNISARLSGKKKILAFSVVLILIIGPYFILKATNRIGSEPQKEAAVIAPPQEIVPLASDKNVTRVDKLDSVFSGEGIIKTLNVNGKIWSVGEKTLAIPEENNSYDISPDFQNPDLAFEMDDLNLIFLVKNDHITAFSVSARKWQDNNIDFPADSTLSASHAYLTYAYFLDTKNNQIYRYPRANGGFGDKINWLKDTLDLSTAKDMAVNDNIYVTDGKNISKFYHGKKQDFTLGSTATPIEIEKIYTQPDSQNLYILDKTNSRVIKLDASGNIQAQYYNPEIASATDFTVDEGNNMVYVSSENGISSFAMNQ
jgi:hypothetical protein